jgi:hypothetical protein
MSAIRRGERGSVLLAVVLLVSLMAAMVATYSRDALLGATRATSRERMVTQTDMDSALAYAGKAITVGKTGEQVLVSPSGNTVTVTLTDAGSTYRDIQVSTSLMGHDQVLTGMAEVYPTDGDERPTLTAAARSAVLASPSLVNVTSDTTYSDASLSGVYLVRNGARLTLEDCILTGAIVGESALYGDPEGEGIQPALIDFSGSVILEPGTTLRDSTVVAPLGQVSLTSDARLQNHGFLVAEQFDGNGVSAKAQLHAPLLVSSRIQTDHSGFVELGNDRTATALPAELSSSAMAISRVVFDRAGPTDAQRDAIKAFTIAGYLASEDEDSGGGGQESVNPFDQL